jgi:hypothetical protein
MWPREYIVNVEACRDNDEFGLISGTYVVIDCNMIKNNVMYYNGAT